MSMNLCLLAKGTVKLNGKDFPIKKRFVDLLQTPTVITDKALASDDPQKVYEEYLRETMEEEKHPVFDPPIDFWNEEEHEVLEFHPERVVGWEVCDGADIRIKELREWIEEKKSFGLDIIWTSI